jgi:hypothetical protein
LVQKGRLRSGVLQWNRLARPLGWQLDAGLPRLDGLQPARLNQAVFRVWPNSQGQEIEDQVRGHKLLTVSSPEQGNVQAYSYRRDPGSAVANQWYCENAPSWGKKGELGTLGCRFPNPTAGSPWVKYIDAEGYGSIFAVSSSFRYDGDISYLPEAYSNPTNLQTEIVNKLKKVDDPA